MRGFDSLLTVAIGHQIIQHKIGREGKEFDPKQSLDEPIVNGLVRGMKAGRFLQAYGYDTFEPKERVWQKSSIGGVRKFAIEMVRNTRDLSSWMYPEDYIKGKDKYLEYEKLPIIPIDMLGRILGASDPLEVPMRKGETDLAAKLRDRESQIYKSIAYFQCTTFNNIEISEIINEEASNIPNDNDPAEKAAQLKGYGSFDRRWWSFTENAISPDIATVFSDFLVEKEIIKPNAFTGRGSRKKNANEKILLRKKICSLILAYAILYCGEECLIPRNKKGEIKRFIIVFRTAIETFSSIASYSRCLSCRECQNELLERFLKVLGLTLEVENDDRNQSELSDEPPPFSGKTVPPYYRDINTIDVCLEKVYEWLDESDSKPYSYLGLLPIIKIGDLRSFERKEIENYRVLQEIFTEYVSRTKETKPLNIGVFGPAGSGKTFAVKSIVKEVFKNPEDIQFLTFNLSQFLGPQDLVDAFEEIQDVGIQGKMPVVFWDEYDTTLNNTKLAWLSYFLGPMNDGLYFSKERSRRLPKAIFVFAGSMFASFTDMHSLDQEAAREIALKANGPRNKSASDTQLGSRGLFATDDWIASKGADFKSRLTGTLDVLGVNRIELDHPHMHPAFDVYGHFIRRAIILRNQLERIQEELFDFGMKLRIPANVA